MWVFKFPSIWYETYQLKRRRQREHWSDEEYYRRMYSIAPLTHAAEGDKFAGLRGRVSAAIQKDKETARVLDVATGRGYQARKIWDDGYRRIWACDLIPERVEQARALHDGTGIEFSVGNAAQLDYPDRSFDAITISAALHDLTPADVTLSVQECARLMPRGGRLVVLEPRWRRHIRSPIIRSVYPSIADILDESIHMRSYVELDLISLGKQAGFECAGCEPVWYGILCLYVFVKVAA